MQEPYMKKIPAVIQCISHYMPTTILNKLEHRHVSLFCCLTTFDAGYYYILLHILYNTFLIFPYISRYKLSQKDHLKSGFNIRRIAALNSWVNEMFMVLNQRKPVLFMPTAEE